MSDIYEGPSSSSVFGQWSLRSLRPMVTLAVWRLRRTWSLLIVTGVGMLAAVMLICSVPLLSKVAMTAGLRDVLTATSGSNLVTVSLNTEGLSTRISGDIQRQLAPYLQQNIGVYTSGPPSISVDVPALHMLVPAPVDNNYSLDLYATSIGQAASHIVLTQGQLPDSTLTNGEIQILITPETAQALHVEVGSLLTLRFTYAPKVVNLNLIPDNLPTADLKVRVAGLFHTINDAYWQGNNFAPVVSSNLSSYTFFVPDTALYAVYDQMAAANHADGVFSPLIPFTYTIRYGIDTSKVTIDQLNDLEGRVNGSQLGLSSTYGNLESSDGNPYPNGPPAYPYLEKLALTSPLITTFFQDSSLVRYSNHVAVAQIPVLILAIQIIALILFFVSMMTGLLVDRQADTIAVIRSRGASGLQIFGALLTQGLGLSVLALLLGPLLALFAAILLAPLVLPANQQSAVSSITADPVGALTPVLWYAGVTVLAALLAMVLTLLRAFRMDVLSSRREAARTTQRPFWQRFNLDIVAGVVALCGYFISLYLTSLGSLLDARTKTLVSAPLALVGPLFLVIGCMLLFLRLFPYLLRFAAWLAARGRTAPPLLALAQMARAPQQAVRMTMLLALSIAFIIFTLIFTASQAQHLADMASYEAGADFSGNLSASAPSLTNTLTSYQAIPGVKAASAGYTVKIDQAGNNAISLELRAVDADTFAHAALWPLQASTQSVSALMTQLRQQRTSAISRGVVPVIVDAVVQTNMRLHIGSTFTLSIDTLRYSVLNCVVVGTVDHIPTVNDSKGVGEDPTYTAPGGMLLDYQTYNAIYQQGVWAQDGIHETLPVNQVWLSTGSDQASLTSVRAALTNSRLALGNLYDRRALAEELGNDPLYLNLVTILVIGTAIALLLALVGDLLASWLSARVRLTNFAVLRALGTTPRQVMSVLTWEQSIIYITALLLGVVFGFLLAIAMVPTLTFSSAPARGNLGDLSNGAFYALQHILPTAIVVPISLLIAFAGLIIICVVALGIMVWVVSRPALNQILRVNQD